MIAVNVAQFTFAQTIFRAAKAMRMCGHARPAPLDKLLLQIDQTRSTYPMGPAQNGFMNFLSRARDCHKILLVSFLVTSHLLCARTARIRMSLGI